MYWQYEQDGVSDYSPEVKSSVIIIINEVTGYPCSIKTSHTNSTSQDPTPTYNVIKHLLLSANMNCVMCIMYHAVAIKMLLTCLSKRMGSIYD